MRLTVVLGLAICALVCAPCAYAVPEAGHVRADLVALRLNLNDYCTRYQVKLTATITAEEDDALVGVEGARFTVTNPAGQAATVPPLNCEQFPKKFKAAQAKLLFKLSEDTVSPDQCNVPAGFFMSRGPYAVTLSVLGQDYHGGFSFGEPLALSVAQDGAPAAQFCLMDEHGFTVSTAPAQFGPVYYRKQDLTNAVFQLANMDEALAGGDYHAPRENPRYLFQVSVGDGQGGPVRLVDPERYIEGYQAHMIRSEQTSTPLNFGAGEFGTGDVVVIDFMRESFLDPDVGFTAPGDGSFSCQVTVQERVLYTLNVESAPTPAELGTAGS
jgi:hypothetical protein